MRKRIPTILILVSLTLSCAFITSAAEDDGSRRVEFRGLIESLPTSGLLGVWVIGGRRVMVSETTRVNQEHGAVSPGIAVEVHGSVSDAGLINATQIEVLSDAAEARRIEFRGVIERLPDGGLIGTWLISGRRVHVADSTTIKQEDGRARVGAAVEVHGTIRDDAEIDATVIEVLDGQEGGRQTEFRGTIESLPPSGLVGIWIISAQRVQVTESTAIDQEHGRPQVGSLVEVHGVIPAGQSIVTAIAIEVKSTADEGSRYIEFRGTITELPASGLLGVWKVDGRTVRVTERTRVDQEHGRPAVGATVEVKGWPQDDGSILADVVEVKGEAEDRPEVEFRGRVERLPADGLIGDWLIGGRIVHVTSTTTIKRRQSVQVGSTVAVKGVGQADGSVTAVSIKVKG